MQAQRPGWPARALAGQVRAVSSLEETVRVAVREMSRTAGIAPPVVVFSAEDWKKLVPRSAYRIVDDPTLSAAAHLDRWVVYVDVARHHGCELALRDSAAHEVAHLVLTSGRHTRRHELVKRLLYCGLDPREFVPSLRRAG